MDQLNERERTRRCIGAGMLCVGVLFSLWGERSANAMMLQFGKTTAAFGIVIYFLGRIKKLLSR